MHRTKAEYEVMHKLDQQRIRILEEKLQATRDVNYELRQDLTAQESRVCNAADCTEIKALERRLRHLLESEFIRSFDEADPKTHEYIRDILDADRLANPKSVRDALDAFNFACSRISPIKHGSHDDWWDAFLQPVMITSLGFDFGRGSNVNTLV